MTISRVFFSESDGMSDLDNRYAIAFDMDTKKLARDYKEFKGESWTNAYGEIKKVLKKYGFETESSGPKQHSVYFSKKTKGNPVSCTLAIIELASTFEWFNLETISKLTVFKVTDSLDLTDAIKLGRERFAIA